MNLEFMLGQSRVAYTGRLRGQPLIANAPSR
jgi:hypothetical protein